MRTIVHTITSKEAKEQQVKLFKALDGKCPFRDWLEGLRDRKTRQVIRTRINRVGLGNFGDSKAVSDGVMELRIDYGPGFRVYFGRDGDTIVVLLCGGDKRTQNKDIELAKKFWKEYKETQYANS